MEMPVFALHTVLFPGRTMGLRVFEPRYRALMDDVLPAGTFVVVAIRHGQEVGGPYEAYRVGVTVAVEAHDRDEDGSHRLRIGGRDRFALIAPSAHDPYPVWQVEPFPDEGGAGTDDVEAAAEALWAYLSVTGEPAGQVPAIPHDPVTASYVLAAATPALVPTQQSLLEVAGAGERLSAVRAIFRRETALVRALGAGAGGAGLDVSPN
ncbi:MAG TPA: LON peptidase substrate-binding domain-containing protein [Actinomycetota bacterium]|nr:LON peptidase substrate-binding domain-containing protein [Actinomycetota bacterium]